MKHPMRYLLLLLALGAGLAAADRPVLVLSGTGQYQPLATGDAYLIKDAGNFVLNTTTGTKFGTATSQKLAFYNSTPVIQQTGDVATALSTLGLVASPTVVATTAIDSTFRILGSGDATKKLAFEVDAQTAGKVLTIDTGAQTLDRTLTVPVLSGNDTLVTLATASAHTATVSVTASGALIHRQASTQDGISLLGRAGGSSSYSVTLTPTTLTASRTATFPDADIIASGSASALTSGRVPYATTGGLLLDSANLTFNGTNFAHAGTGTFGTGTGAVSLNGTTTVATGKTLLVPDTTAATSTSTGAVVIGTTTNGGLGVAGAAWIGGAAQVATAGKVAIGGGQVDVTTAIGLRSAGSDTIASAAYMYWNNTSGAVQALQLSASNHLDIWSNNGSWVKSARIQVTGEVIGYAATDSTSISTGALQLAGGAGVTKALWVGGLANIAGALTIGGTTNLTANEFRTTSTAPQTYWKESDGSADNKTWAIVVNAEVWKLRVFNDAEGVASDVFSIARSTTTVGTITIGGATTQATNWAQTGATTISTGTGTFTHNGSVTIVSGKTLTHNDATLHRTATTLTNGAGALTGTLTNSPATGNPTKWIPIDDNGTTRYIPAW